MIVAGKTLLPGQRYTFHIHNNFQHIRQPSFRANVIDVTVNDHGFTLHVDNYGDNVDGISKYPECIYSFPLEWIGYVETINDITKHKSVLPEDTMLVIDGFIP